MDFNAFELIQHALEEELVKQEFAPAQELDYADGKAVWFAAQEVAYALRYNEKSKCFELCSTTLKDGEAVTWRSLSTWLFDPETGDRSDADSIANDFLDVVRGPKRVAVVQQQQKRKRGKDDERSVDPMFFMNRLAGIFPELKDELNEEKIVYGQVRYVMFLKASVVPKVEDLAARYPDSDPMTKLCALFDDMYQNGDLDTRSILSHSLLNTVSDAAFDAIFQRVGEALQKDLKFTRKLRGKTIKPEKKKKEKKVDARLET